MGIDPNERSYRLRPRLPMMLFCMLFFGSCAAFMGHRAANNDVGLILNGVLEFGVDGATIFYWVVAGVSAAFVMVAAVALMAASMKSRYVSLTADAIQVSPTLWSNKQRTIAYADATDVARRNVAGQESLIIQAPNTKIEIAQILTGKEELEEITTEVERRCAEAISVARRAAELAS